MVKTSVYLPDELKARLGEASTVTGESEATIIRSALEGWLRGLVVDARRRSPTGADLRASLSSIPPPDERFSSDIAAALALISAEGNDPWAGG